MTDLIDRSITIDEAEGKSVKLKALSAAKAALLKEVEIETWEEAENVIPEFTKEDALCKFEVQKGKPLPKPFKVSFHVIDACALDEYHALHRLCARELNWPNKSLLDFPLILC